MTEHSIFTQSLRRTDEYNKICSQNNPKVGVVRSRTQICNSIPPSYSLFIPTVIGGLIPLAIENID